MAYIRSRRIIPISDLRQDDRRVVSVDSGPRSIPQSIFDRIRKDEAKWGMVEVDLGIKGENSIAEDNQTRICEWCGGVFYPIRRDAKCCCQKHSNRNCKRNAREKKLAIG